MSDHTELKRLADTLLAIGLREDFGAWIAALEAFEKASGPDVVLALLTEIQALSEHKQHMVQLREADGFESWAAVLVMVDQLKAANAGLKTGYAAHEEEAKRLRAEIEALRKAAEQQPSPAPGFGAAFYKVAEIMGVTGARPCSPMEVFETEILPALEAAVKSAERYHWLLNSGYLHSRWSHMPDRAIDAAMSKEAGQ